MSRQSRSILKNYFTTGSIPSQADFANLIDSCINEKEDQVMVDGYQNVGLGFTLPPARLAVASVAGAPLPLTMTLTAGNAQAQVVMQNSAQQLASLVYPGDVILLSGITQLFSIVSVLTNTAVILNPVPTTAIAAAPVTLLKNLLYVGTGGATPQLVLTNRGQLGIGVALPSEAMEVNGNVRATGFIGNGSQLVNLAATNLVGQIPASALPPISFSNILGQLAVAQLPAGYNPVPNGINSFTANSAIIQSGGTVMLSWTVTGADNVVLSYLQNYQPTTLISLGGTISLSPGTYQVNPDFTQTFTLTAYKSGAVLNQAQLVVTVIPPIQAFMKQCFIAQVPATAAVSSAGAAFGLGKLCASNVMLLATAMKGQYTNANIYQAIPAYYLSLNYAWNANTNGSWITSVLYPNQG